MPSHCHNHRLFHVVKGVVLPDTLSGLITIHVRHVAVHQNEIVVTRYTLVLFAILYHFV